jgi:hypothetical protein
VVPIAAIGRGRPIATVTAWMIDRQVIFSFPPPL